MPDNRGLHSHHSRSVPSVHAAAAAAGVGGGLGGGPPYPDHYSSKASLHDGSDRPVGGGNLNRQGLCALGQAIFFQKNASNSTGKFGPKRDWRPIFSQFESPKFNHAARPRKFPR